MIRPSFRTSVLVSLTVLAAAGCAPEATPFEPAATTGASFVSSPIGTADTEVVLAPGATHQVDLTKVANGKAAPATSVEWSSSNDLVASVSETGLVTAVASGEAVISATRGVHVVTVTIRVGNCDILPLGMGVTSGSITTLDCPVGSYFADIYSIPTATGEIIRITSAGMAGQAGIKVPGTGAIDGSWQTVPVGFGVRVIGNGSPLHAFARAQAPGSYTLTRTAPVEAHDCNDYNFLLAGSAFATTLTPANSCQYPVEFGVIEAANGMPLNAHYYNMLAEAGKTYTVTITGVSNTFNPALTVFAGPGNVFQSAPMEETAPSTRTVTFSRATTGYVGVEVASGRFIGGLEPENWTIEQGSYTMTVSH